MRNSKHIMQDKDLSIDLSSCTNADYGYSEFQCDLCCEACRDFFQHYGKATCVFQQVGVSYQLVGFCLSGRPYGIRAEFVN